MVAYVLKQGPTFYSSTTRAPLHTYEALPSCPPAGVVVFLHGLGMHAQMPRYRALARACVRDHSLAFVAWDCPHHGTSSRLGAPDHPLRPLHLTNETTLVSDACDLVAMVRDRFPGRPLVLVGESLGGGLSLRVAPLVHPDGVCCVAGLVRTRRYGPGITAIVGLVTLLRMVHAAPREARAAARLDPLVHTQWRTFPARRIVRVAHDLLSHTRYDQITCPVHFAVGDCDLLYSPHATFQHAVSRCDAAPPLRRTMHIVRGARHDSMVHDERTVGSCAAFAAQCAREASHSVC